MDLLSLLMMVLMQMRWSMRRPTFLWLTRSGSCTLVAVAAGKLSTCPPAQPTLLHATPSHIPFVPSEDLNT